MLEAIKPADMQNVCVFIARYSGPRMGPRRFDIYKSLTKRTVQQLRQKLDKLNRANRLERSNSQLSQSSMLSQEDEPFASAAESIPDLASEKENS